MGSSKFSAKNIELSRLGNLYFGSMCCTSLLTVNSYSSWCFWALKAFRQLKSMDLLVTKLAVNIDLDTEMIKTEVYLWQDHRPFFLKAQNYK